MSNGGHLSLPPISNPNGDNNGPYTLELVRKDRVDLTDLVRSTCEDET